MFNKKTWQVSNFNDKIRAEESNRKMSDGVTWGEGATLKMRIYEIGDWDMDATDVVYISHDLGGLWEKVRMVSVIIRHDNEEDFIDFNALSVTGAEVLVQDIQIDENNISLRRDVDGYFDAITFNNTSFNRGWVTIFYEGN
jgi:hypothetical protein